MDNRNDLQWRPEDWQHTLGHLRRAERLLALKTWGLGTAVVGTIATGTALYLQPEEPNEDATVATVEQVEAPANAVSAADEIKALAWDEALSPQGEQEADGFEPSSLEASLVSGSTSPIGEDMVGEPSAVGPDEGRPDGAEDSPSQGIGPVERAIAQAQTVSQAAVPRSDLRLLKLRNGILSTESLAATLLGQPRTGAASIIPTVLCVPARLSILPVQRGVLVESPHTVAHAGPVRIELTPGLSLVTEQAQWSAWHPAPVYGSPDVLRRVTSDFAIQSQLTLSGMMPIGHLVELGVTAGLKHELTRRMDHGVWNADANAWDEVIDSEVWGRVEEANPWSALLGLRMDYAVAPEWKVVAHLGWSAQRDLQRKQPAIEVLSPSPLWLQIGIQR